MPRNTATVGSNAGKQPSAPKQLCTDLQVDLCAPVGGGDLVYTAADLVQFLVDQGVSYVDATGTPVPVAASDVLHQISITLASESAEGECWDGAAFVTETATTCNAISVTNGIPTNLDPHGSRDFDGSTCTDENNVQRHYATAWDQVTITEGSIVKVVGKVCQDPVALDAECQDVAGCYNFEYLGATGPINGFPLISLTAGCATTPDAIDYTSLLPSITVDFKLGGVSVGQADFEGWSALSSVAELELKGLIPAAGTFDTIELYEDTGKNLVYTWTIC